MLLLQPEVYVSLIGPFFGGTCISDSPVKAQETEPVFTTEGKIHSTLTFETRIAIIVRSTLCLDTYIRDSVRCDVFQSRAITVFPVVAVVENSLEPYFIEIIEFPIR